MQTLLSWDTDLLLAINSWHTPFFDNLMWNISDKLLWLPLYLLLAFMLYRRYGRQCMWLIAGIGIAVGLADFISSGIIKDWVMRPRPTREPALEGLLHLVNGYRGGRFGFVSSHAADTFSLALLFSLIWRNWKVTLPLVVFSLLNCWSRLYLGVHYPTDIAGGLIVGTLTALGIYYALRRLKYTQAIFNHKTPVTDNENNISDSSKIRTLENKQNHHITSDYKKDGTTVPPLWHYAPLCLLLLTILAACFI